VSASIKPCGRYGAPTSAAPSAYALRAMSNRREHIARERIVMRPNPNLAHGDAMAQRHGLYLLHFEPRYRRARAPVGEAR
jgi:hypothetical protein